MQLSSESQVRPAVKPQKRLLSLDDLAARSFDDLSAVYQSAPAPTTVKGVDGTPRGRMLAVNKLPGLLANPIRAFAASNSFVWDGKTFSSTTDKRGKGHNRVSLPGVLGKQSLFPFETFVGKSAVDGRDAIILDYDLSVNPTYIRHIHDEIREVEAGLYMGPAMWKTASSKITVLWFALDTQVPATF
ncbi:MAG: hypothetical protein IPK82_13265 [Polyangiaceae bacterium]|nr:hypothetical protein [Polyangiaceae bacterium]